MNFVFKTCEDQLSGVCSYPEARFHFDQADLKFAVDTPYSLGIDLRLNYDPNTNLGPILVQMYVLDHSEQKLASYRKSTILKSPNSGNSWSLYRLIRNTLFLPLYIVGYFDSDPSNLHFTFTKNFVDHASNPAASILIEVQNRFVLPETSDLLITAHFGLLRYFLYQWPIISYFVVFAATFAFLFCCLLIFRAYCYLIGKLSEDAESKKNDDGKDELMVDKENEDEGEKTPVVERKFSNSVSKGVLAKPPPKGACYGEEILEHSSQA
ncbi:hypothetical protein L596_013008 [Steinernema carpocapsae]|uniref:Seipin n=1 Tax=Steinernema carpocapsae TaxID=34508 RepID=A0A4V6A4Y7_STECR|nr:hypothetical protein L596_013008 [Steinernema carpocapsae]